MKLEIRQAIKEQRKRLKEIVSLQAFATEEDAIKSYNLAIKSYLKGVYEALRVTQRELEKDHGSDLVGDDIDNNFSDNGCID